jgi:hypothetical protein
MKIISTEEAIKKINHGKINVALSLSGVDFNLEWEPEIFHGFSENLISEFSFPSNDESGEWERLGFFRVPDGSSEDRISSFVRYLSVKLFVCDPKPNFFEAVPKVVKEAICKVECEWSDSELDAASLMSGFSWMILTNGDFHYLFE